MAEEVKKEEVKKDEVDGKSKFERDVKMLLVDFGLLQKKYNLVVRPVITPYGPDLNIGRPEVKK